MNKVLLTLLLTVRCVLPCRADDFDSGGVPIHYTVTGSGPPVVGVAASRKPTQ